MTQDSSNDAENSVAIKLQLAVKVFYANMHMHSMAVSQYVFSSCLYL